MRRSNTQVTLSTIFFVYLACFLGIFIYNLIDIFLFKGNDIIEIFRLGIAWDKTLSLYLNHFLAIHTAAVVILYSVFFKPDMVKSAVEQFSKLVSSAVITFIVLAIIYLFLIIITVPSVNYSLQSKTNLNDSAVFFLKTANESYKNEDYKNAYKFYDLYLRIDNNNREVNTLRQEADDNISNEKPGTTEDIENTGEEPFLLLNKARNFFNGNDFASAHYYANLVLELEPENTAARILADEAYELLYTYKPSDPNPDNYTYKEESYSFYELKVKGYSALQSENYIEAFEIFEILSQTVPSNTEIAVFLEESRAGLNSMAFFYDEIEEINSLPNSKNIIFINSGSSSKEIILIGQLFYVGTDVYFKNVEIIRLNEAGSVISSTFSEYGKITNNYINLNYIKEGEEITFDPAKIIMLNIDPVLLPNFSAGKNTIETISLNNLFSAMELYDNAGYNKKDIELAFLIKIVHPCLFLILSLLCISIGWAYRARYLDRPPLVTYLIMPVTPLVNAIIISLIIYFHKILLGYILATAGFAIALIALIIMEFVLFIISLLILSGQRME
jgi:hypothetical protein